MATVDAYRESGGDWALPKDRGTSALPSVLKSAPAVPTKPAGSSSPSGGGGSSGGGLFDSITGGLSSLTGGLGGLFGGGGMPSISPSATSGDATSSVLAPFYFSSPFAVGSGAKATADQSGAGAQTGPDDLMKTALYVGAALIAAAILAKTMKS